MRASLVSAMALVVMASAADNKLNLTKIVSEVAPKSVKCAASKAGKDECRTADVVGPRVEEAMTKYNITNTNVMAAVISLMAIESVEFQYKRNQHPGTPGQGTVNMQSIDYNIKYAASLPEISSDFQALNVKEGAKVDNQTANKVLDLVIDDRFNFGSAAWFIKTQCNETKEKTGKTVEQHLADDIEKGFIVYMKCVGVNETAEPRPKYFALAKQAFGLKSGAKKCAHRPSQ